MRMYGSTGLRTYIRNHCDIAKHFEELLRTDSRFEVMAPRTFSLICFRLRPRANDADRGYSLNAKLVEALNIDGDILVTHTVHFHQHVFITFPVASRCINFKLESVRLRQEF
jgi:aromatic-L-amino-acid decarboxylase